MIRSGFKFSFKKTPELGSTLVDLIPCVLFQLTKSSNGKMKFKFVTSKIEELTGLTPNQFLKLNDPIQNHIHTEDLNSMLSQIEASSVYLTPFEWQGRINVKNKTKWIHIKANPQKNTTADTTWSGVLIDITLQRFLLDQFLQLKGRQISDDKISSLNQMASGIAHEINTPLTTAKMNIEMIQNRLIKNGISDDVFEKCIQRFEQASEKISKVIDRLRRLSRNKAGDDSKVQMNLNEIVQRCLDHVSDFYDSQHGIKVVAQLSQDPLMVVAHEGKIFQALLSLITNSKDAVIDQKEKCIEISTYSTPVYNYIKIKDNGVGIPKAMLNRVFEPFFTTKQKNMNSGVGLSLSGTIFSEHDAIIDIASTHAEENTSQHGTEVTIKFPLAKADEQSA